MEVKPKADPPAGNRTHLVQDRFGRENVVQGLQRDVLMQIRAALKRSVPPARVWSRKWATHTLGGPVHTLGGGSSTIIQEQRLLPVVVVGLQDVPAAQFQVEAEAQVKKHKRKLECCSHLAARLFLN